MGLIDAEKLIEEFEEYDMYLWRLPKDENPHRDAFRSQLNWCINKVREQHVIPYKKTLSDMTKRTVIRCRGG